MLVLLRVSPLAGPELVARRRCQELALTGPESTAGSSLVVVAHCNEIVLGDFFMVLVLGSMLADLLFNIFNWERHSLFCIVFSHCVGKNVMHFSLVFASFTLATLC